MTITAEQAETYTEQERILDDQGIDRPVYTVAGKKVIFRTRQETPSFIESGTHYHVIASEDTAPLPLEGSDKSADYADFIEGSQETGDRVTEVVTATPEGLLDAALELGGQNKETLELLASLRSGEYSAKVLQYIDTIIAALNFGDDGEKLEMMDTDGHALVLEMLLGDEKAKEALGKRLEAMYKFFNQQHEQDAARRRSGGDNPERYASIEAIDPKKVVLVHSTSHGVDIAEDGSVTLRPASAFREDKFPRSSIHFTPNGQVTGHYAGDWGPSNSLIVTNFADVTEANGVMPAAMSTADTYFTLDPGGALQLPDVRVVRSASADATELIHEEGRVITYKDSEHYTEEETAQIKQLAREYGVTLRAEASTSLSVALREIALRVAMQEKGASTFVTIGAHYAENQDFQDQYDKLASETGVTVALHVYNGDSRVETSAARGLSTQYSEKLSADEEPYRTFPNDTTLQAVRQVVASGYIPARPFASSRVLDPRENDFDLW